MIRGHFRMLAVLTAIVLLLVAFTLGAAEEPANEHFERTWERTDQPVSDGTVARTWIWGPEANTGALVEDYLEALEGSRTVQYFDKSRMEINNPAGDPASPFYVTNGLLVIELMTGRMQFGNDLFQQHEPSTARVAGDQDDPNSPSYASLAALRDAPALPDGSTITQRLNADGSVTEDAGLAANNVTAAFRLTVPGIDHQVASPFWEFLNSSGPVVVDGQVSDQRLFDPWFYATGYPITEAYWADVKIAGTDRLVLMQCFERRCLTYTPGNPTGFLTEAGNVGQHYYTWRYEQTTATPTPSEDATATPVADATPTPAGDATATPAGDATAPPSGATGEYNYITSWGSVLTPMAPLHFPAGLALDASNSLWVTQQSRAVQFNENGLYLDSVGEAGSGPTQLTTATGLAFGADGRMYVVDQTMHRVLVFNSAGEYEFSIGSQGNGNGTFVSPSAIAIGNGQIYVCDVGNDLVQRFTPDGVFTGQFGGTGASDTQLDTPQGLAIDSRGNVLVADSRFGRIKKFSSTGAYIGQFGSVGSADGQFDLLMGIAVDADDNVYAVDSGNHRIQKFDSSGVLVSKWGQDGTQHGEFHFPRQIKVDARGDVYVSDSPNQRVQKFSSSGSFLFQITDNRRGLFNVPADITVDQNGDLLVADPVAGPPTLSRYSPVGVPLDDFLYSGPGVGQYDLPYGVAVNSVGNIYVVDAFANRVVYYSATWNYLGTFGTPGSGPGQFNAPHDIVFDTDGNIYVADSGNHRVQKFDANGTFVDQWGGPGAGNGKFNMPESIAVAGERVYVTDYTNDRVQVFSRTGEYIEQWGSTGSGVGQLNGPIGIAVSQDGFVLVVENGNNRVQVFAANGDSVAMLGAAQNGVVQFDGPLAVTIDESGNAYVTEVGNHRVQKFAPAP